MPISTLPDFKFFPVQYDPTLQNEDTSDLNFTNPKINLKSSRAFPNGTSSWTHCGPLLSLDCLPPSYHTWSKATFTSSLLPLLLPFLHFVHSFLTTEGFSHYWLTIRATRGSTDFDIPRWHTDALFFPHAQWKLCATLLGPGTLLLADSSAGCRVQRRVKKGAQKENAHLCTTVRCLGCAATADVVRARLAKKFENSEVVQAEVGKCVFLRLGDEMGAVHSEPPSHGERVFVNVVPGGEEELKGLMGRWGMEFPRSWSLG